MKKSNLKISLTTILVTCLVLIPIFSGFTIMRETPQINVEVPNNLKVSQAEIFDGMIVNYTFTMGGMSLNSGFEYVYDSGDNFNVSWWMEGFGTGTWVEDASNRLISMSAGPGPIFGDGSHAPVWIFTNVSLYDIVLISVDGVGDQAFNITTENIFNIPGFGSVEVWQLEDLTFPGGIAWYEKSTGILIKGNFTWPGDSYTFEIFNTNAAFSNVPPVSGLFEGLFMDYNWSVMGLSFPCNVSYSGYSVNTYNTTWDMPSVGVGHWSMDTTTRLMSYVDSSPPNFLPGTYTPCWIFTNVSLGVNVTIAIITEGDHIFEVTKSLNVEFPGFGPISVWELQDLDGYGGVAWYEKNSGILLNGTFIFSAGAENYSFNLLDTNAIFSHLLPFPFTLSSNATDPDTDGIFDLEWTTAEFAKNYTIYEHSSYITAINGSLTPIVDETTNMTHALSGYSNGVYYFIAVAKNNFGMTLSNCYIVTVIKPSGGEIPGYGALFFVITLLSISVLIFRKWKIYRAVD